ncbi:MAG: molybdopterin-dependent oxidoreductase [Candidatus Margulisbacteria bacterium]|nr:molybdopterin-dependent oxidoreductase [Candidatus Margulisiibacteriota bacterium]
MIKKSKCLFCSLGCGVSFRTEGDKVVALDYDKADPINLGALCPRGHYNLELINHPGRLMEPQIGKRKVSWEEAVAFIRQELKLFNKEEIGCLVSCLLSNESALAAARMAQALGIKNILTAGAAADLEAYEGNKWQVSGANLATLETVEQSEALLIVGDLLSRSPVLAKRVNKVKYGKRGNKIIVIDPNQTHTTWFATNHLACKPGTEAVVLAALAGELPYTEAENISGVPSAKLQQAAEEFRVAAMGTVIYVPQSKKQRNDLGVYYAKKLAAASPNKGYLVYYLFGNTLGVNTIIDREAPDHPTYHELLAKIDRGEVKSLLMFGEDISAGHAELQKRFRMLKFVVFAGHFESESPAIYDNSIILPLATQFEGGGSYLLADGTIASCQPVAPKVGSETLTNICGFLAEGRLDDKVITDHSLINKTKNESDALAEVGKIEPAEGSTGKPITYFGNNHLVSNFFWYQVNKNG